MVLNVVIDNIYINIFHVFIKVYDMLINLQAAKISNCISHFACMCEVC